jgi:branched-chain amino acid transport system ATP-binding protein
MHDRAEKLLADPRVGRLFLGGHIEGPPPEAPQA